jgi:hypothetical protein
LPPRLRAVASLVAAVACIVLVVAASGRRRLLAPEPPPTVEVVDAGVEVAASVEASASAPPPEEDAGAPEEATCSIPDRGSGHYGDWKPLPLGHLSVPEPPPTGRYDLVLHLHGSNAARRVIAPADLGVVIAGVDAGVGSQAYAEAFFGARPLEELLAAVEATLAPAHLGRLIITSWSAGYGAVHEILVQHPTVPSAIVLLDSLHASYAPNGDLVEAGLMPFLSFAQRAQQGEAVMVVTHSEIRPPGYASTSETASWLLHEVGGRREYAGLEPVHGVEAKTAWRDGNLIVRGFTGAGKEAHCAHLMMLDAILRDDVLPALPAQ